MKRLYRKYLIWYHGSFKSRITRCHRCSFRIFNSDSEGYSKMIHHELHNHFLSPREQLDYLNQKLWESQEKLIRSLIDAQDDNPYGW